MASISPAPMAATALTPPSSSHGEAGPWEYSGDGHFESVTDEKAGTGVPLQQTQRSTVFSQIGSSLSSHHANSHGVEMAARTTQEHLSMARWARPADISIVSPPLTIGPKTGRAWTGRASSSPDWPMHDQQDLGDDREQPMDSTSGFELQSHESSKWIHRDKLAKIESEELEAAGIFVPRSRAPSKQRRERLAKDPATWEQMSFAEPSPGSPDLDLRAPEEIAQEEANAYFTSNGIKGGSRIPVAKTSPAPIPLDFLERGSQAVRKHSENPEGDTISYTKPRSRSVSLSASDPASIATTFGPHATSRRLVTDGSPMKNTLRKSSITSKASTTAGRPKTRSGPSRDFSSTRPSTRAGEPSAASRTPEGDPPWMANSYKPDPRLPPDQQLLPTVAKRLQQEKWEKEGKFGDAYDKEFRPLNDNELAKPPLEPEKNVDNNGDRNSLQREEESPPKQDEWPPKLSVGKSPTLRHSSYSTMPKIADKPAASLMTTPRTPLTQHPLPMMQQAQHVPKMPDTVDDGTKKRTCGCCVVM